jgi:riboflavin kinase/FMN adenylyltransferase
VRVVHSPHELEAAERAVAIGTFDGVHRGHRAVIEAAKTTGLRSAVVTFHPHPRKVLGHGVELLATFERRLELVEQAGPDDVLVVEFTLELAQLEPEEFVREILEPLGTKIVIAGEDFRFGRSRRGDIQVLRTLGIEVRPVQTVEGVSSSQIRQLLHRGDVAGAAALLGRPPELEGVVVTGDRRGKALGFPTANLSVDPDLLVPANGIYAGASLGRRAGISIGLNPHYGGAERRIEAFLLDFDGDLYGRSLRLELWRYLREEQAFASEADLVDQIARDVEAARTAVRPA